MDAILVFDATNDLVLSKTNSQFAHKLIQYSKRNNLYPSCNTNTNTINSNQQCPAECSTSSSSSVASCASHRHRTRSQRRLVARQGSKRSLLRSAAAASAHSIELDQQHDSDKRYTDVLRLLLTPYVASLRLSHALSTENLAHEPTMSHKESDTQQQQQPNRLLDKFMSSISLSHADDCAPAPERASEPPPPPPRLEFMRRKFATIQMPIECLSACQIVFCEEDEFMFLHLHEFERVSAFKLRCMQRRVDMFARLSALFFGHALGAMRADASAQSLKQVYDMWLAHQFEPNVLLEASERLVVGSDIESACECALRRVLEHVRVLGSVGVGGAAATTDQSVLQQLVGEIAQQEPHSRALLFADTKLVACAGELVRPDELVLLELVLRTFNAHHNNHCHAEEQRVAPNESNNNNKLRAQLVVFLKRRQVYVPHTLRLIALTRGITLLLLAELPNAQFAAQLGRLTRLVGELAHRDALAHTPANLSLNQLAKINDSVCAVRSYFLAPSLGAHDASSASLQTTGDNNNNKRTLSSIVARFLRPKSSGSSTPARTLSMSSVASSTTSASTTTATTTTTTTSQPSEQPRNLYESLSGDARRKAQLLVSRLDELVKSNVHVYMRQTFNVHVDEHKREALFSCVLQALRSTLECFVLEPQAERLREGAREPPGAYLRATWTLMEVARLEARARLGDYLEYLAVKSACNLGAAGGLVHDMPALGAFVYVDRARNQLLRSELDARAPLSMHAILEADLSAALAQLGWSAADSSEASSSSAESCAKTRGEPDARSSSSLSSIASATSARSSDSRLADNDDDDDEEDDDCNRNNLCGSTQSLRQPLKRSERTRSQRLAEASSDLLAAGCCSEQLSRSTSGRGRSSYGSLAWTRGDEFEQTDKNSGNQTVDQNLVSAFTCFIYNKLAARGARQHTHTHNDGTYVYSYFLWFQRNQSVRSHKRLLMYIRAYIIC